jgi:hypothetical protein
VSCDTLQATAFELPPETRIDVRFVNAANGATLHQASPTTDADGGLVLKAKVQLTGVDTVRMTVARAGAGKAFAFSELTIPGECPLPFTEPSRWPALTTLALGLLAAGSVLLRMSAGRRRQRAAAR